MAIACANRSLADATLGVVTGDDDDDVVDAIVLPLEETHPLSNLVVRGTPMGRDLLSFVHLTSTTAPGA